MGNSKVLAWLLNTLLDSVSPSLIFLDQDASAPKLLRYRLGSGHSDTPISSVTLTTSWPQLSRKAAAHRCEVGWQDGSGGIAEVDPAWVGLRVPVDMFPRLLNAISDADPAPSAWAAYRP